jgi:hypothetical protein
VFDGTHFNYFLDVEETQTKICDDLYFSRIKFAFSFQSLVH